MKSFLFVPAIAISFLLVKNRAFAQAYQLADPLKIQVGFSGSFGELRSNHFHSGVDLRTQGKTGFPIYAAERGYVARIKVSATGYGRAIYINHPNGLTTVYAHLERFNDTIAQYVKGFQYKNKRFEVDLYLKPNQIKMDKEQVIGYSGNSGSSGGPHLHFEIRRTYDQELLQPINFFTQWKKFDSTPPLIDNVYIYQIDSALYLRDSLKRTKLTIKKDVNAPTIADTIYAYGNIGFGITAHDLINRYSTRCGISECTMMVNNRLIYSLDLNSFSFTETKNINSLIDYGYYIDSNKRICRLWVEPNNRLKPINTYNSSNGSIHTTKDSIYHVTLSVIDAWENRTSISAIVKGIEGKIGPPLPPLGSTIYAKWDSNASVDDELFSATFPGKTFYHDMLISYNAQTDSTTGYPVIAIMPNRTPLRDNFSLSIKTTGLKESQAKKMFIGRINKGDISYIPTNFRNGIFTAQCPTLGKFTICSDSIPPTILAKNFSPKKVKDLKWLEFTITDNIGIGTYNGYIDGKWEVFEWDQKNQTLRYEPTPETHTQTWHQIKVVVVDKLDNKAEYSSRFFW